MLCKRPGLAYIGSCDLSFAGRRRDGAVGCSLLPAVPSHTHKEREL